MISERGNGTRAAGAVLPALVLAAVAGCGGESSGSGDSGCGGWTREGDGREIAVSDTPETESFDDRSYVSELVWTDCKIATYSHVEGDEAWDGSGGAARFDFLEGNNEDDTFLGYWRLLPGSMGPVRTVHIRWLVKYGPQYADAIQDPPKTLLVYRCNDNCSGIGDPGHRGLVMEEQDGGRMWPFIMEGIETNGNAAAPEPGKPEFNINSHIDEWISYEAVFDLDAGESRLYIDTQDGEQDSDCGALPYQTYEQWDTTPDRWHSFQLMGYWEPRAIAGAGVWVMIDEVAVSRSYIGPPPGFPGACP